MKIMICVILLCLFPVLMSGCMEPPDIPDIPPQERLRWQNPEGFGLAPPSDRSRWPNAYGWGLEPETEPYSGLIY